MKIQKETLRLYAITDRKWLGADETLLSVTEEIIGAGASIIQLREKNISDSELISLATDLKKICDNHDIPLIINDRPDIAKAVHASGVHVGLSDMAIEKTREYLGPDYIIGGSAHNVREALLAQEAGADYIGCGAVFGSSTKKDAGLLSLSELKKICAAVTIPVVAIGGITLENAEELKGTGIAGVALISALYGASDKSGAVRKFIEIFQ